MTDVIIIGGGLAGIACGVALADSGLQVVLIERDPFRVLNSYEPSPYISCYLWFDRKIDANRFVSHLWSPTRLNYDFYDLSRIRSGWAHRPSVVARNIIYSHRAHALSDDDIIRTTVQEISEFAPAAASACIKHGRYCPACHCGTPKFRGATVPCMTLLRRIHAEPDAAVDSAAGHRCLGVDGNRLADQIFQRYCREAGRRYGGGSDELVDR